MKLLNLVNESVNRKQMLSHFKTMGLHKNEAEQELDRLIDEVKNLPDPIKLYRILMVDDKEDIDTERLGSHYSRNKKELISSHSYLTGAGEKYFIVTVKAPKSLVDVKETIANNILYPNEEEITLKNKGRGVEIISIREIRK